MGHTNFTVAAFPLFLLSLSLALSLLACDAISGKPNPSRASGIDDPVERAEVCREVRGEINDWEHKKENEVAKKMFDEGRLFEAGEEAEEILRDLDRMRREFDRHCSGAGPAPILDARHPTPTPTSRPRRPTHAPTPTQAATSTLVPTPTLPPAPTPSATPEAVLGESPLIAAFAEIPASHNGREEVQFQLLFSEPVSTSYKTLRDVAIRVENGSVRESKRVNKRNDLWMVTVEPEGNLDMVITLTAPAGCGDAASVCTEGGKALANSPTVLVRFGQ